MSSVTAPVYLATVPTYLLSQSHWPQGDFDRPVSRLLQEAFSAARLELGQRMFDTGIDDDETGEKIRSIDTVLARGVSGGEAQELRSRRNWLLMQLADAALEDDAPLPGADDEFDRALALKRELEVADVGELLHA